MNDSAISRVAHKRRGVDLARLVSASRNLEGVRRNELGFGDRLLVSTRNSVYSVLPLGDGTFSVSGGWFQRAGGSPATMAIAGCTWGGSALAVDWVAVPGMFLEFGNGVRTTRIREVRLIRDDEARRPQ
ncbi:MAG TPA: hypothetical protein VKA53_01140 [Thermoanaerobaculia bacterium]|nr:hypothetical protein [Thermoanaerobaculia bacterium]